MPHNFSDVTSENEAERLGRLYPVILADYNPKYPELYRAERDFLLGIFGDSVLRISHIGSTAVPDLISKPTIDILLEIKKDTDLTAITETLTNTGYIVNKPPMDIITYIKGYGENGFEGQVYHIHVREFTDHDAFYFRDYLLAHPETAKEYGELKQKLLPQFEHDRDGYTAAKGEFIGRVTALAREEFKGKYISNNLCYCGHDCSRCVTHLATINNDDALRRQAQKFYLDTFGQDISLDKLHCNGGRSDNVFYLYEDCPWIKCCKEKGLSACSECNKYPCKPLADYQEKYVNKCNQMEV